MRDIPPGRPPADLHADPPGLRWADRNPEAASELRGALVRCASDRARVPDRNEYKRWLRQRQRRGEYPPTVFAIDLLFNFDWQLALYDAGLVHEPPAPRTRDR